MYKWNAEDYHRHSSEQQRIARELISKLDLKGDERILDIGCGDGKVTVEVALSLREGSIVGIDSSQEMIEFAINKFPVSDFPNLSFQCKDARNLDFDREFDLIYSCNCLHWIVNHIPVLEGVKKSLKPSGKVHLLLAAKGHEDTKVDFEGRLLKLDKWNNYFRDKNTTSTLGLYNADEYRDMLEEVGLEPSLVEEIPTELIFQGKEGFKGLVRTTWFSYTNHVPEDLREELIEDLTNLYLEMIPPDRDGLVHMPMIKLEVEATKV